MPSIVSKRTLNIHLTPQQLHFGVSPVKIASERSDHCDAFDKLGVEGRMSICEIAAGSGAGFGHRAVGSCTLLGAEAQALRASEISAGNSVAHGLRKREFIGVLLGCLGMGAFGCAGLLFLAQVSARGRC